MFVIDEVLRHGRATAEIFHEIVRRAVGSDADDLSVHSRHQCRARWAADGILRVGARESHTSGCQCINVGRSALCIAVASKRLAAEVIGNDEQHIELRLGGVQWRDAY